MLHVFLGYDPRQPIAYQVLAHSIWSRASQPLAITRVGLKQLPITRRGLTDFTYARFIVPYLCHYKGYAIFLDSDFLCLGDLYELMEFVLHDQPHDLWVVKGQLRFEWSSLMVFNNERCEVLTPAFINDPSHNPLSLQWATSIGSLPAEWNHLVGYDTPNPAAKLIHYTQGIPDWPETRGCEFSDEWNKEALRSMATVSFEDLMGKSVHAKPVYERLRAATPASK